MAASTAYGFRGDQIMADDKTRVIPRTDAPVEVTERQPLPDPRLDGETIVFFCPQGHELKVPRAVGGKRGQCKKCGAAVHIPAFPPPPEAEVVADQPADEPPSLEFEPAPKPVAPAAIGAPPPPPSPPAAGEDVDWNFISGIDAPAGPAAPVEAFSGGWETPPGIPGDAAANPMARLLARLWAEREHGGIVEVHLVGGTVILPEEFAARWSSGTHGVFASQAVDGTVTLTAVAWETVQRIVVRHLSAVPGDMFE